MVRLRTFYNLLVCLAYPIMGLACILLTVRVSQYFALAVAATPLLCYLMCLQIRCRACGHPIGRRDINEYPLGYWLPVAPRRCAKCNAEIDAQTT